MDIQIRGGRDQAFCQRWFAEHALACGGAASDHDFRYAGETREFGDLIGHVFAIGCFNGCAELARKAHIFPQPVFVSLVHG